MSKLSFRRSVALSVVAALTMGGMAAFVSPPVARAQTALPRAMGALLPDATDEVSPGAVSGTPQASVDLRASAVPTGDQGLVGSCTTWAIGYDLVGWYATKNGIAARAFAPMYLYSQVTGGSDIGSRGREVLERVVSEGVDTQDDYVPQGNYNYWTLPTAAQKANAAKVKASGYKVLFQSFFGNVGDKAVTAIKAAMTGGQPVSIGFKVRQGFVDQGSVRDLGPTRRGVTDVTTRVLGRHEVLALAYDANGLIIQNSWGAQWGYHGYAKLSWDVVRKDVFEAFTVSGLVTKATTPAVKALGTDLGTSASPHLPNSRGTTSMSVASNTSWKATSSVPWLTVSPAEGFGLVTSVTLTATGVPTAERSATVTLTTTAGSPVATKTVTAVQAGPPPKPSTSAWTAPATGGTLTLPVSASAQWKVTTSDPLWLTATPTTGPAGTSNVTVTAASNYLITPRTGTLTFTTTSGIIPVSTMFTVTQPGLPPFVALSASSWSPGFPASKGTLRVMVSLLGSWKASSNASWLTVGAATSTSFIQDVKISVTANTSRLSRTGVVTFTTTTGRPVMSRTFTVTQAGKAAPMLSLSSSLMYLGAAASADPTTTKVAVTSNTSWTVTGVPLWMTVTSASRSGSESAGIAVKANKSGKVRSATVTFKTTTGTPAVSQTLTVIQLA